MIKSISILIFLVMLFTVHIPVMAGYFLSWPQKGELLATGSITDKSGNTYNVTIIPGYLSMLDFTGNQWVKGWKVQRSGGIRLAKGLLRVPISFKHFNDYITPQPWRGMREGVEQFLSAEDFLFTEYMGARVVSTWKEYLKNAENAHDRKSFGWWFAYPWASIKGVVNTTLRVATGIPASALMLSYGIGLRPVWELSFPVIKTGKDVIVNTADATYGVLQTSWGLAVNQAFFGVATPVSGYVWNTAVGVPLSLLGRAPTLQSADGWWVVVTDDAAPEHTIAIPDSTTIISIGKQFEHIQKIKEQHVSFQKELDMVLSPYVNQSRELKNQLDSIDQIIRTIRETYDQPLDEVEMADTAIILPQPPSNHYTVEWSADEKDSLRLHILSILKENATDTSEANLSELNDIAIAIVSIWNRQPDNHTRTRLVKKQDPNRLIQDEFEKIME